VVVVVVIVVTVFVFIFISVPIFILVLMVTISIIIVHVAASSAATRRDGAGAVDVRAGHGHGAIRQHPSDQGSAGTREASGSATRENVSLEGRSGKCAVGAYEPKYVTGLATTGHNHLEITTGKGCRNFENPNRIGIATCVERQGDGSER
jgi:hypothetical protein